MILAQIRLDQLASQSRHLFMSIKKSCKQKQQKELNTQHKYKLQQPAIVPISSHLSGVLIKYLLILIIKTIVVVIALFIW